MCKHECLSCKQIDVYIDEYLLFVAFFMRVVSLNNSKCEQLNEQILRYYGYVDFVCVLFNIFLKDMEATDANRMDLHTNTLGQFRNVGTSRNNLPSSKD